MKTILTAAAIAALGVSSALVSSASAADMAVRAPMYAKAPMVAPFSWAGFYVGANIGVDWASNKVTLAPDPIGFGIPNTLLLIQQGTTTLQGSSVIGGLQAGYNYMLSSNILLGLEGDVDALRARN